MDEIEQAHQRRLAPMTDIPAIAEALEDANLALDGFTPVVRYWDEAWNEIPSIEAVGYITD